MQLHLSCRPPKSKEEVLQPQTFNRKNMGGRDTEEESPSQGGQTCNRCRVYRTEQNRKITLNTLNQECGSRKTLNKFRCRLWDLSPTTASPLFESGCPKFPLLSLYFCHQLTFEKRSCEIPHKPSAVWWWAGSKQ